MSAEKFPGEIGVLEEGEEQQPQEEVEVQAGEEGTLPGWLKKGMEEEHAPFVPPKRTKERPRKSLAEVSPAAYDWVRVAVAGEGGYLEAEVLGWQGDSLKLALLDNGIKTARVRVVHKDNIAGIEMIGRGSRASALYRDKPIPPPPK